MSETADPRMRNGWAEYQRLVLAELERLNDQMAELTKAQRETDIKIALLKEENGKLREIIRNQADLMKRVSILEGDAGLDSAIRKYRGALITGAVLLLGSVIIPLIALFFGGGGGS